MSININYHNIAGILILICLCSCQSYKKIPYLQGSDSINLQKIKTLPYNAHIMPQDLLTITVSCSNPELAAPFNLIVQTTQSIEYSKSTNGGNVISQPTLQQYLVNTDGDINFPVLGKLHLAGLTKDEVESMIKNNLKNYLKEEPIVIVRMSNYKISVLGEVAIPGTYTVNNEKVNIFEALALAHDMTVYGKREDVKIIREDAKGTPQIIKMDLTKADIVNSSNYYLQQNDIVYVTPNKAKATTADITASTTIWFSIVGSLLSFASILIAVFR